MLRRVCQAELVQVSVLLGLGIAIIFWQVLLLGYVQVPADMPPFYDPVMRELTPQVTQPQNPLLSDHISQSYIWHYLAAKSMQSTGKIPLWNPYILAGQPLVANSQPSLFYPPNWLLFWFDPGLVASIRAMFNLFVAGFFTFLFCRALHVSKLGAILAAIAFSFSGALIVGPGYSYANSLVWLPFTMWTAEKMLKQSRTFFWGLATSIGVGLSALGGHPESTFHNLVVLTLYVTLRLLWLETMSRIKLRLLAIFALALVVGMLLGAVQWLPFASWLRYSSTATASRSVAWGASSVFYSRDWLPNLATLVTLLFPSFFGHPVDYTYRWPFSTFQNFLEQSMYFGLVPITLAIGAIFAAAKQKRVQLTIIAVLAIVLLAAALRLPGFEVVHHLPIFDRVNNTRLKWYFSFLGALLAGFGLDQFDIFTRGGTRVGRRFTYAVTAVFGVAASIALWIVIGKHAVAAAPAGSSDSFVHHLLFSVFSWRHIRATISLLVLAIAVGAVIYVLWRRRSADLPLLKRLFVALTFVELLVLAYGYNTTVPKETIFPAVRLTEMLQQDPGTFRILTKPPAFWPNYGAIYGLYHVGGYDLPVFERYAGVYEAQGGQGYRQDWSPDWPLVDWMNVKYVISTQEYDLEKLELVFADSYRVYMNKDALPRAYMVYDMQVVGDDAKLLETLTSGAFPFEQTVLLEDELPPMPAPAAIRLPANCVAGRRIAAGAGIGRHPSPRSDAEPARCCEDRAIRE
jgi:hypothetical protein